MKNYNYLIYTDGFNEIDDFFFKEVASNTNVHIVRKGHVFRSKLIQKIFKIHTSFRLNNILKLPFQSIWYRFLNFRFSNSNPTIHIFFSSWYYPDYFKYIKSVSPQDRIIIYFGDTVESKKKNIKKLSIKKLKTETDLILSYNDKDVKRYNLIYLPLCYSKLKDFSKLQSVNHYDFVFIGASRYRFQQILSVYEKIKKSSYSYYFYVVNSGNVNYKSNDPNFVISDKPLGFLYYLSYIINSKWIIEILDSGTVGTTLRFWDAVMYNKGLITNNKNVTNSKFYNKEYILLHDEFENISLDDLKMDNNIEYYYSGENSPQNFLSQITKILEKELGE